MGKSPINFKDECCIGDVVFEFEATSPWRVKTLRIKFAERRVEMYSDTNVMQLEHSKAAFVHVASRNSSKHKAILI